MPSALATIVTHTTHSFRPRTIFSREKRRGGCWGDLLRAANAVGITQRTLFCAGEYTFDHQNINEGKMRE